MNIVFRADASTAIGTGHVMRCRSLAAALRRNGAAIRFVVRPHPGHLAEMLAQDGYAVSVLAAVGASQDDDARQTIAALAGQKCDWLIVDHYELNRSWEARLRPSAAKIMVVDDLANRAHDCDTLLDPNLADAPDERYRPWVPVQCRLLLGPRYALLRPEYAGHRKPRDGRAAPIKRVMVFMGGADNENTTAAVISALRDAQFAHLDVDVVIGANFVHAQSVRDEAARRPNTRVFGPRPHLADIMAQADLAVGAGGGATWERMCIGLPSIVIGIADNQLPGCDVLARAGLIRYLGPAAQIDRATIAAAIRDALANPADLRTMAEKGRARVDGKGAQRVAEALLPVPASALTVRRATATDALTYFEWVNDPAVRASAINTSPIELDGHLEWFDRRLADPDSILLVLEADGLPVGQIRFDHEGNAWNIDYSLDPLVRGRGWAKQLLKLGIQWLGPDRRDDVVAVVRSGNEASAAAFVRTGFSERPVHAGMRRFVLTGRATEKTA